MVIKKKHILLFITSCIISKSLLMMHPLVAGGAFSACKKSPIFSYVVTASGKIVTSLLATYIQNSLIELKNEHPDAFSYLLTLCQSSNNNTTTTKNKMRDISFEEDSLPENILEILYTRFSLVQSDGSISPTNKEIIKALIPALNNRKQISYDNINNIKIYSVEMALEKSALTAL